MSQYSVLVTHDETGELKDVELKAKSLKRAVDTALRVVGPGHSVFHASRLAKDGKPVSPIKQDRMKGKVVAGAIKVKENANIPTGGGKDPAPKQLPVQTKAPPSWQYSKVVTQEVLHMMGLPRPKQENDND